MRESVVEKRLIDTKLSWTYLFGSLVCCKKCEFLPCLFLALIPEKKTRMSEDMPGRMSEDFPERVSEDMPERLSERQLKVTACILTLCLQMFTRMLEAGNILQQVCYTVQDEDEEKMRGTYVRNLTTLSSHVMAGITRGKNFWWMYCQWHSCRPQDKGSCSCEIFQLFLTGFGAFIFVIHHPYPSSQMHSSPVPIWNFSCQTCRDTTCSTSLQAKKQREERYCLLSVSEIGIRCWSVLFSDVSSLCSKCRVFGRTSAAKSLVYGSYSVVATWLLFFKFFWGVVMPLVTRIMLIINPSSNTQAHALQHMWMEIRKPLHFSMRG